MEWSVRVLYWWECCIIFNNHLFSDTVFCSNDWQIRWKQDTQPKGTAPWGLPALPSRPTPSLSSLSQACPLIMSLHANPSRHLRLGRLRLTHLGFLVICFCFPICNLQVLSWGQFCGTAPFLASVPHARVLWEVRPVCPLQWPGFQVSSCLLEPHRWPTFAGDLEFLPSSYWWDPRSGLNSLQQLLSALTDGKTKQATDAIAFGLRWLHFGRLQIRCYQKAGLLSFSSEPKVRATQTSAF